MADIASSLTSQIGLPAGAIALAVLLVRGATFLEKDASDRALKLFSDLITKGDFRNIGKVGAGLVPYLFERVFGPRSFSLRFISRSMIATTLFWITFLLLKHVQWEYTLDPIVIYPTFYTALIGGWYVLDWLSLIKAKFLMNLISQRYAIKSSLFFVFCDIVCSYLLAFIWELCSDAIFVMILHPEANFVYTGPYPNRIDSLFCNI